MAEPFNNFLTTIGHDLARKIPKTKAKLESYHSSTDKVFSLKAPNVTTVCKLLSKINERKATGLEKIPCKLLKLASGIVERSLSSIFKRSVETGFFPNKWIKQLLSLKRVLNPILTIIDQHLYYPLSQKISKKIIFQQLYDYLSKNKLFTSLVFARYTAP